MEASIASPGGGIEDEESIVDHHQWVDTREDLNVPLRDEAQSYNEPRKSTRAKKKSLRLQESKASNQLKIGRMQKESLPHETFFAL